MRRHLEQAVHLVERFFGHLGAEPPGPEDQQFVHDRLSEPCAKVFWTQSPPDQRHAVDVARRTQRSLGDDEEAIEAALLHDVGKMAAPPGAISRSLATILDATGLPMTDRMRAYRSHGVLGAGILTDAGCGSLAVAFARDHPGGAPDGIATERWNALLEADG